MHVLQFMPLLFWGCSIAMRQESTHVVYYVQCLQHNLYFAMTRKTETHDHSGAIECSRSGGASILPKVKQVSKGSKAGLRTPQISAQGQKQHTTLLLSCDL